MARARQPAHLLQEAFLDLQLLHRDLNLSITLSHTNKMITDVKAYL